MIEPVAVLGVSAGAIGIADTIPYVRDTLRGVTRPHRGTWLIWGGDDGPEDLSATRSPPV